MLFETSVVIDASFQNRPLSGSNQANTKRRTKPSLRQRLLEENFRTSKAIEHAIALEAF